MPPKIDPEHVPDLALEPVGSGPQGGHRIHLGVGLVNGSHQPQPMLVSRGIKVIHEGKARLVGGAGPGILIIRDLRRGSHRDAGGGEEGGGALVAEGQVVDGGDIDEEVRRRKVYRYLGPKGVMARTIQAGSMVYWAVTLLAVYLVLNMI